MIKPFQKNQQLIVDIRSFSSETSFKVWWLGQSGFLLKYKNQTIVFDPYLSDSLSIKYQNTDKPHVRMSELVVLPSLLENVTTVTSSHNHTDHLDAETLNAIFKNNKDSVVNFYVDLEKSPFLNDNISKKLFDKFQKLTKMNSQNSVFCFFYRPLNNSFENKSSSIRQIFQDEKRFLNLFSGSLHENNNEILPFLYSTNSKCTLSNLFDFCFFHYPSYTRLHLVNFHHFLPFALKDQSLKVPILSYFNQKWKALYSILYPKLISIEDESIYKKSFSREILKNHYIEFAQQNNDQSWNKVLNIGLNHACFNETFIQKVLSNNSQINKSFFLTLILNKPFSKAINEIDYFSFYYWLKEKDFKVRQFSYESVIATKINLVLLNYKSANCEEFFVNNHHRKFTNQLISYNVKDIDFWKDVIIYESDRANHYWSQFKNDISVRPISVINNSINNISWDEYAQNFGYSDTYYSTNYETIKDVFFSFAKKILNRKREIYSTETAIYETFLIGKNIQLMIHFDLIFNNFAINKAN
jgi:hypothetical protein